MKKKWPDKNLIHIIFNMTKGLSIEFLYRFTDKQLTDYYIRLKEVYKENNA